MNKKSNDTMIRHLKGIASIIEKGGVLCRPPLSIVKHEDLGVAPNQMVRDKFYFNDGTEISISTPHVETIKQRWFNVQEALSRYGITEEAIDDMIKRKEI